MVASSLHHRYRIFARIGRHHQSSASSVSDRLFSTLNLSKHRSNNYTSKLKRGLHHSSYRACSSIIPPSQLSTESVEFQNLLRKIGGHGRVHVDFGDNHVAHVKLGNPRSRNALSGTMMADLGDAVLALSEHAADHKLVACTLEGTGGYFCSGADLGLVKELLLLRPQSYQCELGVNENNYGGLLMCLYMHEILTMWRKLPLVSVALVQGGAVGGGAELTTCCDFRIMEASAVIHFKQVLMGLSPGWGGGSRLTSIVGRRQALRIMCGALPVQADDGLKLGLCDLVVTTDPTSTDEEFREHCDVKQFLSTFTSMLHQNKDHHDLSTAVRGAKSVVAEADHSAWDDVLRIESEQAVFGSLWGQDVNKAKVDATLHALSAKSKEQ